MVKAGSALGQNLVPNGNFDIHIACPENNSEIYKCPPWANPPNCLSSVDYYHACSPFSAFNVPTNSPGYQLSLGGLGYAGTISYATNFQNNREYVYTEIFCPMVSGQTYHVGFHVSRINEARYAIDRMGMYIADTIDGNGMSLMDFYTPQIQSAPGAFLGDTVNWIEISGTYTAQGGEKYIAIGNFFSDSNTMVLDSVGPLGNNGTYYYIDSVYVIPLTPPPAISISNDTVICAGGSVTLEAGNSGVYYWFEQGSPLDTLGYTNTLTASPDTTTVYELQTCSQLLRVTVEVRPPPTIELGNDTLLCIGQSLVLDATTTNATYQWQDASTDSIFTVTASGTYHVNVTNLCGMASDTIEVLYLSPPSVSLVNDTLLCPSEILLLNAAADGATYSWQDGSTDSTFTVSANGTYHVEVTNQCGMDRDTVAVNYILPPSVELGNDTALCNGQTITLAVSVNGGSYLWQNSSTGNTFTITQSGTYHVTVTNHCGIASDTVEVEYLSPPSIELGSDTLLCPSEALLLNAFADSATYAWQDSSTDSTFNVTETGIYHVEVENMCGIDRDTISVTYISPPTVQLDNDTALCNGQILALAASADSAICVWQNGSTDSSYTVMASGTYHITVTNQCGTVSDTIEVLYLSPPSVSLGNDTLLCPSETLLLNAAADSASYAWQDGSTDSTFTVSANGTYHVEVTNQCGMDRDTVTVIYITPPTVQLGNDTMLCDGQSIMLEATSYSATYLWQNGSTDGTFNVAATGTYHVTVTNHCGTASDTVEVLYLSPPSIELGNDTLLCTSETLLLTTSADSATYTWQGGSTDSTFIVTQAGTYHVEVTNLCGTDRDTITVAYDVIPQVSIGNDTVICMGDTLVLVAVGEGLVFQWQNSSSDAFFAVTEEGIYWAMAPHPCGTVGDTVHISLLDCDTIPGPITIPNVITPNGDGINDMFHVDELPPNSSLSIYNRWGRRIFYSENYANHWGADGFSEGTYFYVLNLPTGKGLKGYVTVIK